MKSQFPLTGLLMIALTLTACRTSVRQPDLGKLYDRAAQYHGPERNPVIVIPGILGSKLVDRESDRVVWGAFAGSYANPTSPDGARLVAHPMREGTPLCGLKDAVEPRGALDRLKLSIFGLPLNLAAYANILGTLGVGGYQDQSLGEMGAIDYGNDHYTCFQFSYDWRRSLPESARKLHEFIEKTKIQVKRNQDEIYGVSDREVKFDIVAHSMGGLVLRYYLRFGTAPLPADGSIPEVTWAGAKNVDRAILVGTPNAGSVLSFRNLLVGLEFAFFLPEFPPAVVGTQPAVYQLLPRYRHGPVYDPGRDEGVDLFEASVWEERGWGLLNPDQEKVLAQLLPEEKDPKRRRAIAREHLEKCLSTAKQFHAAMDQEAKRPDGLDMFIIAGDAEDTAAVVAVDDSGGVEYAHHGPGDGTVLRTSALLDERVAGEWKPHLVTPVDWTAAIFLFDDHLGLTRSAGFADQVLYWLLEDPR